MGRTVEIETARTSAAEAQMLTTKQLILSEPHEWLGDWHPLAEQLGSTDGLLTLASVSELLRVGMVKDLGSLRAFLQQYHAQILVPLELPAIRRAFEHSCRNEVRELIQLDVQLTAETILQPFTTASERVGRVQLQKLRPLRDQRVVQRYLHAVENSEARGWHTLVYGLTLAIYSLPLRQGLLGYAIQTTRGFIHSAARELDVSEKDCRTLLEGLCEPLPVAVESLVGKLAA
jgi:urease accessory protein UreF